jgi:hypothetical protein
MRVNSKVLDERVNLLGELYVRDCPTEFQEEANKLLNMCVEVGYSPPSNYRTITELYRALTVDFWIRYDGLSLEVKDYRKWYMQAHDPSDIERAIRLLIQKHYFTGIPEEILERRDKAAQNVRQSVRR